MPLLLPSFSDSSSLPPLLMNIWGINVRAERRAARREGEGKGDTDKGGEKRRGGGGR